MSRRALSYPRAGRIKATRTPVTVHGESNVAGINTYRVSFGRSRRLVDWQRSKVILS